MVWSEAGSEMESITSELLKCDGAVHNIVLVPLMTRCLETLYACLWRIFVYMSVVVTVLGYVGSLLCSGRF